MCGIFGIISNKNFKVHQALSRLEMLEYRGYDSAGVSLVNKNKLHIIKTVGYIKNLYPLKNQKTSFVTQDGQRMAKLMRKILILIKRANFALYIMALLKTIII